MSERDATEAEEAGESGESEGTAGVESESGSGAESDPAVEKDGGSEPAAESEGAPVGVESEDLEAITERVEAAAAEEIAREIASLQSLVADLEIRVEEAENATEQVEELQSKLARKQADFENFKKRLNRQHERERERATEDLVTRLLGVRDDLARALDQEGDAEIRGGVESTLGEFDRVLADEGASEIGPEPGTEVDPQRHEVMMRVDSEFPEGTIAEVFRPGYEMGEKVLRPAQVTVSEGGSSAEEERSTDGSE